jgi:hypothetical protein
MKKTCVNKEHPTPLSSSGTDGRCLRYGEDGCFRYLSFYSSVMQPRVSYRDLVGHCSCNVRKGRRRSQPGAALRGLGRLTRVYSRALLHACGMARCVAAIVFTALNIIIQCPLFDIFVPLPSSPPPRRPLSPPLLHRLLRISRVSPSPQASYHRPPRVYLRTHERIIIPAAWAVGVWICVSPLSTGALLLLPLSHRLL